MAVSYVKEITRYSWQQDSEGWETADIDYEILVDDPTTSISTVLAHASVPDWGSAHPENAAAKCRGRNLRRLSEELHDVLVLHATFSTKPLTYDADPLNQLVKGGMSSAWKEIPATHDAFGNPLVNSAGDLFEGVTRKQRLRRIPVTANFSAIPNWLFDLSDTLNAAAVTIHGKTYPAGTCLLTDVQMPDEPTTAADGSTKFWPITYNIEVNPAGYFVLLPDRGLNEIVYQTRADAASPYSDTTKTAYDAETDATLKRSFKRRIKDGDHQDIPSDIWLDHNGRAVKLISLTTTALSSAAITAGSAVMSATGLDANTHTGCLVIVPGAGPFGRKLESRIKSISGSNATLESKASTTVSGGSAYIPGARFKYFVLEDLASWSAVPLPNNQP